MRIKDYQIPPRAKVIQLFDGSDDFIPTEVEIGNLFSEFITVRHIHPLSCVCLYINRLAVTHVLLDS